MPISEVDNILRDELTKVNQVIKQLKDYPERQLSDLPPDLLKLLRTVKVLPPFSSTGLESTNHILDNLYLAQYILKRELGEEMLPVEPKTEDLRPKTEEQKNIETEEQRNRETEEQRNKETEKQKNPSPRPRATLSAELPRGYSGQVRTDAKTEEPVGPAPRPRPKRVETEEQKNIETEKQKNRETEKLEKEEGGTLLEMQSKSIPSSSMLSAIPRPAPRQQNQQKDKLDPFDE